MPAQFNRAASSYLRPPGNALVANPAGTWTIAVWIAPQVETGSVRNIFYLNPGNVLQLNGSAAQFIYGGGISSIGAVAAWTGGQYGPWTHLAVTKNGTTEVRYYLNGVYAGNRTTGISADSAQAASIGAYNRASDFYAGHMAALKAWNRVLTDAEIDAESKSLLVTRLTGLAGCFPLIVGPAIWRDWTGQAAELVSVSVGSSLVGIGLPFGAPNQVIGRRDLSVQTVFVSAPVELGAAVGDVTIEGGRLIDWPLVEMAVNDDAAGTFARLVPATRIRGVSGSYGFKSHRTYLSDNARAEVELVNDDGAYTDGGGLFVGQWARLRIAGTGELLFTGRIVDIAPGYARRTPYVRVRLDTLRNDLSIPARSVLLKDTNTRAAAAALMAGLALSPPAGGLIWDYSNWDEATWVEDGTAAIKTFGETWTGLAAAGGYGKPDGDLDVLGALAELMAAEDGRALWGRHSDLELYSRQWLDDARDGAAAHTLTDEQIVDMDFRLGADYANDVTVRWTPTRWKAGATVYTYEPDNPVTIKPGDDYELNVRFRVEGSDRVLAAENPIVTVTQSGPTVSVNWDGDLEASGGTLKLVNPDLAAAASVSKVSITAAALIANDVTEERRSSVLDQTLYGLRAYQVNALLLDRAIEAVARADREFATWNERAGYTSRIELRPKTRAEAIQWMTLPFGTALDVQSERMRHGARYLAIGADWSVAAGGRPADVTLFLEPVVAGGLLRWDDPGARGLWDSGRWAF